MKQESKHKSNYLTPREFKEAMEGLKALAQLTEAKAELRVMLDRKSNAEIRANLLEYESHHTIGGAYVSEEAANVLNAELIRRGPYGALLNPRNCTNQKIL